MHGRKKPPGYEGLMEYMMLHLGFSLDDAVHAMDMCDETVFRLMQHCAACGEAEDCRTKLVQHPERLESPPGYCLNRKLLLHLQSQLVEHSKPGD